MANAIQSDVLGKFVWYDQMSNDLPGSEKFYSQVVGWSLEPNTMNSQKYTLLKTGATMVGGLMPIPEDAAKMGVRPAWMGYIAVDDVKKCADKVKAAGGAIHRPPTEIPNVGTFAVVGDPSGAGFLSAWSGFSPPKATAGLVSLGYRMRIASSAADDFVKKRSRLDSWRGVTCRIPTNAQSMV